MNKLQTDFRNGQQSIKRLFRELFLIQIQLERFNDQSCAFNDLAKELIQMIDQLLDILIDVNELLES